MTHNKTEKHLQSIDLCQAVHFPHIVTYTCSVYIPWVLQIHIQQFYFVCCQSLTFNIIYVTSTRLLCLICVSILKKVMIDDDSTRSI